MGEPFFGTKKGSPTSSLNTGSTMDTRALILLIMGHLITDTTQGGLPTLLPLLQDSLGLTYAASGAVVMTMNLTSSVIQPLFGYLTDRFQLRWLLPVGVALSGVGFALLGLVHSYAMVLATVVLCGLGVASYHPEAFKAVLGSAGQRKVVAVSWFMVGGNLGMGLGPLLVGAYLALWGLKGVLAYALPGLAMAALLMISWGRLNPQGLKDSPAASPTAPAPWRQRLGAISILVLAVVLRSWVHSGVMTYVPFWYTHVLGGDPVEVGPLLTTFLVAGVLGTMAGAPLAERIGPRRFFIISVLLTAPLLVWMLFARGWWLYPAIALVGGVLISTWSTVIVMAQQILPDRAGMASGLMVGFAVGSGGVGATVLGWVADGWGVETALWAVTVMPLLSGLAASFVPLQDKPLCGGRLAA